MALTWTDVDSKTNDYIIPALADVVYKASPIFVRIKTRNNHKFEGGMKARHPITYAELNGGAFGRGGTFDTSYVNTDTALEVNIKFYYVDWRHSAAMSMCEPSLIDLDPAMGTRRKRIVLDNSVLRSQDCRN